MRHKISQSGISLIKQFEGLKLGSYQDSVKVWTIGYGTTSADSTITGTKIGPGMKISQQTAENWLAKSLNVKYGPKVDKYDYIYHWTQNQFDALISFAYNIGSIDELLSKGALPKEKIPEIMLKYHYAKGKVLNGLVKRRQKEVELFLKQDKAIGDFVLQTKTALNMENSDYKFLVGNGHDYPYVYCIRKYGSGTHKVEVHILEGKKYNHFKLQTVTSLD